MGEMLKAPPPGKVLKSLIAPNCLSAMASTRRQVADHAFGQERSVVVRHMAETGWDVLDLELFVRRAHAREAATQGSIMVLPLAEEGAGVVQDEGQLLDRQLGEQFGLVGEHGIITTTS